MRNNIIVIDDFYSNVDDVRSFALNQDFNRTGNFPGHRTKSFLIDELKTRLEYFLTPFSGKVIKWNEEFSGSFQFTTCLDRSWIHTDNFSSKWAGVCYLTPDAPISSGTGLFMLKDSKKRIESNLQLEDSINGNDITKWELVDKIGNVYNRLVLYRSDLFHSSLDYFGTNKETGRLFQVFFIDTEY